VRKRAPERPGGAPESSLHNARPARLLLNIFPHYLDTVINILPYYDSAILNNTTITLGIYCIISPRDGTNFRREQNWRSSKRFRTAIQSIKSNFESNLPPPEKHRLSAMPPLPLALHSNLET
jgi:hypothetical protein